MSHFFHNIKHMNLTYRIETENFDRTMIRDILNRRGN
jgi:hypothetical protein